MSRVNRSSSTSLRSFHCFDSYERSEIQPINRLRRNTHDLLEKVLWKTFKDIGRFQHFQWIEFFGRCKLTNRAKEKDWKWKCSPSTSISSTIADALAPPPPPLAVVCSCFCLAVCCDRRNRVCRGLSAPVKSSLSNSVCSSCIYHHHDQPYSISPAKKNPT